MSVGICKGHWDIIRLSFPIIFSLHISLLNIFIHHSRFLSLIFPILRLSLRCAGEIEKEIAQRTRSERKMEREMWEEKMLKERNGEVPIPYPITSLAYLITLNRQ